MNGPLQRSGTGSLRVLQGSLLRIALAGLLFFGCAKQPSPEEARIQNWQQFVKATHSASTREKLVSVNNYFNAMQYSEDPELYGREDYWATLRETLTLMSGDCEDLAIAKYFTLRDLDVPESRMRITYVIPVETREPHMVLTYQFASADEPVVLDSLVKVLLPVSRRHDLIPVYSFNMDGYWLAKKDLQWQGERVGHASKLSLWWDLLRRMVKEDTFYTNRPVILTDS